MLGAPLFTLDGHKWASVEHYYQGSKFKVEHQDFYLSFSLDSGSEISTDPAKAKTAGGKSKSNKYNPYKFAVDADFFLKRVEREMNDAQTAKFTQNPDLKRLLVETKDAKLVHYRRGDTPIVFDNLMILRDKIKRGTV